MEIESIQCGNKALSFIAKRIKSDKYRGRISSEHNRYDMQEIYDTVRILNSFAPDKMRLQIRDTDLSKRPFNYPEEFQYAQFCECVKSTIERKKGTQDSIRKNIFLDLHRMGLISRYDKNGNPVDPYTQKHIKYVSLTDFGIRFANENNIINRSYMFAKALDLLLCGYLELTLDILSSDNEIDKLTKYEFMFFISAVNSNTDFDISQHKCVELIKEFKKLSTTQVKGLLSILKKKLNPKLYCGDKTTKRDWNNWYNKICQLFCLFGQTAYFDIWNDCLFLKVKTVSDRNGNIKTKVKRSTPAKLDYFKFHKVEKKTGFELHHVVPLSWAENPDQYKLIDNWKNMVYIDAYSHAIITHNNNQNVIMKIQGADILLSDFQNNTVNLAFNDNIIYLIENISIMLNYNLQLIAGLI